MSEPTTITPEDAARIAAAIQEQGETFDRFLLAMAAGARAISKSKRLDGTTYVYDIFGDHKEIPYFRAAKLLDAVATSLLERSADHERTEGT